MVQQFKKLKKDYKGRKAGSSFPVNEYYPFPSTLYHSTKDTRQLILRFKNAKTREQQMMIRRKLVSAANKAEANGKSELAEQYRQAYRRMVVKPKYPLFVTQHEEHQEQLIYLVGHNVKNSTLVLVDMHDDMLPDDIDPLKGWTLEQVLEYIHDSDREGTWIEPAVKHGAIKKIIWVVPDVKLNNFHRDGQKLLGKKSKLKGNQELSEFNGAQVLVTSLKDMPKVTSKNTVLSVDSDFLGEGEAMFDRQYGERWIAPEVVASQLKKKVPNPKLVSTYKSDNYLDSHLRTDYETLHKHLEIQYQGGVLPN